MTDRDDAVVAAPGSEGMESTGRTALIVPGESAVTAPIVVRNDLWTSAEGTAYDSGRDSGLAHLAELAASSARCASPLSRPLS